MSLADLARQRMTNPAKPKAEGDEVLDAFVQSLVKVVRCSILQGKEQESAAIVDYLHITVKNPEALKTAIATAYTDVKRFSEAEVLLRQVLAEKPDFGEAQIALAANLLLQDKPGAGALLERVVATNLDPFIRQHALNLLQAKNVLDVHKTEEEQESFA